MKSDGPLLLVHGGAGFRKPRKRALEQLSAALTSGFRRLFEGGTALDAVTESVKRLEDSGAFNAGMGGTPQLDGVRRLDAAVMDGSNLQAGSVINLEGVRNPILAARIVMELPHVTLTNTGARRIADAHHLIPLPEGDARFRSRRQRLKKQGDTAAHLYARYFSTVGAVARDRCGNLAVATSTGGVPQMLPGRVGDTPLIGAGLYADNSLGAVACTGIGEFIIRLVLAKEICMSMRRLTPLRAAERSLRKLLRLGGHAGVIVLNRHGTFSILHTTEFMPSGFATKKGIVVNPAFHRIR